MQDPTGLFTYEDHIDQRTIRARTLVVTLGSFVDCGHVQRIIDDHVLASLPNHLIGRFDADELHDYGGRRPLIVFDRDHFRDFTRPEITLHHVTDADGEPFLLLRGPEPSLQWETLAESVGHLVDQFSVERTVLVQSMPSPAPHTRPVTVSRYSGTGAIPGNRPLLGTFRLSASFPALLSVRLGEAGHDVLGLLAHVPHYLTDYDQPGAAAALLGELQAATEVSVPIGSLTAAAEAVARQIDAQVTESGELAEVIGQLEAQYDAFVASENRLPQREEDLPSAEELGKQAEEFLKGLGDADPEG